MKVFLPTADKFHHILPVYAELFNKYWPNQDVTVLCYSQPTEFLPENFTIELLGMEDSKYWTNGLIPYFEKCTSDYFALLLEDLIPIAPVNQVSVDKMEAEILKGASKAMLHSTLNHAGLLADEDILVIKQGANYRTTLHPAIWTKDYFLKYLKKNMTPWEFETKNMAASKADGAKIVSLQTPNPLTTHIFNCLNLYTKGQIKTADHIKRCLIDQEDFTVFTTLPIR